MWAGSTRGPLAPPGKYQVRLTAAGVTKTQDFAIKRNAAVPSVTDADLQEQFKLAKAISDKVTAANEAVLRIRNLKARSPIGPARASDAALKAAAQTLDRQADRGRRGDLSVPQPQQPGSAELSDQVEQQAGGAAGHRRERRRQADRSVVRGVQGPVGAARPAGSEARCARPHRTDGAEQDSRCSEAGTGRGMRVPPQLEQLTAESAVTSAPP